MTKQQKIIASICLIAFLIQAYITLATLHSPNPSHISELIGWGALLTAVAIPIDRRSYKLPTLFWFQEFLYIAAIAIFSFYLGKSF